MSAPVFDAEFLALQQAFAGQYSLERELGRGGMGVVYLAREVSLDRLVAIKVLPPALAARPGLRERFVREARTAAKLSHPHVVPIFRVGEAGPYVYFAMASVDGETVGQRLRSRGSFPPGEASRILREAAWALAYAHAQGVVHRDVKPDNILLERGSGRALLTDFGIAHVAEATALTDEAMVMGTAHFMSPEQASGEAIDGRSDLYALGVVGYLMLTGRLPFDAPSVPALLAKHLTEAPPPIAAPPGGSGIPAPLARTIERCLAKAPAARFATGEALAEALTQASQEQRQLPAALRVWLQKRDPMRPIYLTWSGFTSILGTAMVVGHLNNPAEVSFGPVPWWGFALIMAGVASLPLLPLALFRLNLTRRTLAAGYTLDDLRLALRDDVARRHEEMAVELPERDSLPVRLYQLVTYAALPWTAAVIVRGRTWWSPSTFEDVLGFSIIGTVLLTVIGSALGLTFPGRSLRSGTLPAWRLKYWESRFGRWTTKAAGFLLRRRTAPDQLVQRPTELAIGLAAEQLFRALPKATRVQLGDLPAVVHQLETHASAMRTRLAELDALLVSARTPAQPSASLGRGDAAAALDAHRDAVADQLREARDTAASRLEQTVAALETIRLDLLRLQGGVGDVARLTTALELARELDDDVRRLVHGLDVAERTLDPRRELRSPPEPIRSGR